jgi:Cys-tRNA(Pro) deacylase
MSDGMTSDGTVPGGVPAFPQAVTRVVAAARAAGLELRVQEFPQGTRTARDAASAVGVALGQIVKSLVFLVDAQPVVALVSGDNRLDTKKLAALADASIAGRADAEQARAATGYVIGGTPPFGHAQPLRIFVDRDLLRYETVWAAAGTPHHNFPITPADLVRCTGGIVGNLAVGEEIELPQE